MEIVRRARLAESVTFGPGGTDYSTLTIAASGALVYGTPVWVGILDAYVNGVTVCPSIDGSGNNVYMRPLVLRVQTRFGVSTPLQDVFFIVPTSGIQTLLPLFSNVYQFALYAVSADQSFPSSVVVF